MSISPSQYTKGWEHAKHFLAMFGSSLRTHIAVSFFLGILGGTIWFYSLQPAQTRGNICQYFKAGILGAISEKRPAIYDLGEGDISVASGVALAHLQEKNFQGRTFSFVLKQWLFRVMIAGGFLAVLLSFGMISFGEKITEDKHKRGAKLYRLTEFLGQRRKKKIQWWYAGSAAAGVLLFALYLGPNGRQFFGDFFWAGAYQSSEFLKGFATPSEDESLAWFYEPEPGFREVGEYYQTMKADVYGGASGLVLVLIALGFVGSSCGLCYFGRKLIPKKPEEKPKNILNVAGLPIKPGTEVKSFVFFGSPGSGKSTTILELLDQIRARGERAIVYDPSGEFIEKYYREGKDILMNPLDQRYKPWNLWTEIEEDAHYAKIASSLFPPSQSGHDRFWIDAASTLFRELIRKLSELKKATNAEVNEILRSATVVTLEKLVAGTPAQKFVDSSASDMAVGVLASMASRMTSWEFLPDCKPGETPFSIKKFIKNEESDSWMFLTLLEDQSEALRPLISMWADIASSTILSLPPSQSRRIWVVLDELPSLQRLPSLEDLLARGRKHGACGVLGIQSMPQLRKIYGDDGAKTIVSMTQTRMVLKSVEPETAKWLSNSLGEKEIQETRESSSMGAEKLRDGVSFSANIRTSNLVLPAEIMGLKGLTGYLQTPDHPNKVFFVEFTYRPRPNVAPIYLKRVEKKEEKPVKPEPQPEKPTKLDQKKDLAFGQEM